MLAGLKGRQGRRGFNATLPLAGEGGPQATSIKVYNEKGPKR